MTFNNVIMFVVNLPPFIFVKVFIDIYIPEPSANIGATGPVVRGHREATGSLPADAE